MKCNFTPMDKLYQMFDYHEWHQLTYPFVKGKEDEWHQLTYPFVKGKEDEWHQLTYPFVKGKEDV